MNIINDVLVDKLFPDKPKRTKEIPLLEEKSVSGESIIIRDAYPDMPFKGLHVYGKSTQVTTTGAQLFDVDAGGTGWLNQETGAFIVNNDNYVSEYIPVKRGAQYYINYDISQYVYSYDSSKQFLRKETYKNSFAVGDDVFYIRFAISNNKEVALKKAKTIMLNEGSSAKPYEPYTGGKPSPSIEYPQEIVSVGDDGDINVDVLGGNLIDISLFADQTIKGVSGKKTDDGGYHIKGTTQEGKYYVGENVKLTLEPGFYYISDKNNLNTFKCRLLARIDNNEGTKYYFNGVFQVFRNDNVVLYFQVEPNTTVDVVLYPMLNVGKERFPYEPYKEPQTLTLKTPNGLLGIPGSTGGNYTDSNGKQWVCDEIDLARGKYVQRVEKVKFDGSADERWKIDLRVKLVYANINLELNSKRQYDINILCNSSKPSAWNSKVICFVNEYKRFSFYCNDIPASVFENADNFKAWLVEHPLEMVYQIAEPIERDLSPEEIQAYKELHTNYPTTVIMNDENAGMKVTYLTPSFIPTRESALRMWFKENPII